MGVPGPLRVEDEDVERIGREYKRKVPSDHGDQMDLTHDDRDGGLDEDADENIVSYPQAMNTVVLAD